MKLKFSTKWGKKMQELEGQPTFFEEKLIAALSETLNPREVTTPQSGEITPEIAPFLPKRHTIRTNNPKKFKPGVIIQAVMMDGGEKSREDNLGPELVITGIQKIKIEHLKDAKGVPLVWVSVDGSNIGFKRGSIISGGLEELALNDGFDSAEDFLKFFSVDFQGSLIHWTETRY